MRFDLPPEPAIAYIRETLAAVGGFSALLLSKRIHSPFAIAGAHATAQDLLGFQWGHDWGSVDADAELMGHATERTQSDWWAIYHNVWSRKGFLRPEECGPPSCFSFEGSYCHVGEQGELPFEAWYLLKIGFGMVIVLVSHDPRSQILSASAETSQELARKIADTAVAVFVSAYDDESWVGAEIV